MSSKRLGLAVAAYCLTILACSKATEPEFRDRNPPAAITDLELLWAVDSTASLTWTAPGDDGRVGKASEYDVRYSPASLEIVSWEGATRVEPVFAPHRAGTPETLLVEGLGIRSTYSFAVKSVDDEGNWSGRSNLVWLTTGDKIAPDPITNLSVVNVTHRSIALVWRAPGDDGSVGTVTRYLIRYMQDPITDFNWAKATQVEITPNPQPAGSRETFIVDGLESSTLYYIAIRSQDDGGNQSELSNVVSRVTSRDKVSPDEVFDLSVVQTTPHSVTLDWTAPGDDGSLGTVAGYDLRYSEEPITEATWLDAKPAEAPYPLVPAGNRQEATIGLLDPATQYNIALKAVDDAGNQSLLSNVVTVRTPEPDRVWHVLADGTGDAPTIQAAIDSASVDAVIVVGPGTYSERLNYGGKDLVTESEAGPEATILDGSAFGQATVVRFGPGISSKASFRGFTISESAGEAMFIERGSPVITHNVFVNNKRGIRIYGGKSKIIDNTFSDNGTTTSGNWGGAMTIVATSTDMSTWPDVLVENNRFLNNKARFGGAAYLGYASAMFRGNLIQGNECYYDGGAIFTYTELDRVTFEGNVFRDNVAGDHGGAIAAWHTYDYFGGDSWMDIRYNLFVGNVARGEDAEGVNGSGGAMHLGGAYGVVKNNTIVFNQGLPNCGEGGIGLDYGEPYYLQEWIVERNIIAFNTTVGIGCTGRGTTDRYVVRDNLLFGNTADLGCGNTVCDSTRVSGNIIADPLFCDPENGDFHLAPGSPALDYPGGWLGAFPGPGCASAMAVSELFRRH